MLTSSPDRPGAPPAGCSTRPATSIRTRWAAIRSVRAASQYPTNALEASTRKTATTTASQRSSAPESRLDDGEVDHPAHRDGHRGLGELVHRHQERRDAQLARTRRGCPAQHAAAACPAMRDNEAPLTRDAG